MSAIISYLREGLDIISIKKCILDVFEIDERNVTIESEVMAGYIHFISCLYVFPVVPGQLSDAGYDKTSSIEATALACAIGCILSSYITNLPFVIAPPTSVSIYLAVSLQQMNLNRIQGDSVVMLSGCALLCVGIFKPVTALVTRLIPDCVQASTAVGIGLITAVAGAIELDLVVPGKYTIVEMGAITPAIIIALITTILIIYASHVKKYKAAYFLGLIFGTVTWWWYANEWPETIMRIPRLTVDRGVTVDFQLLGLLANLLFLYILTLSGLSRSMSDLAQLTHPIEETIPRGHWLFIICGLATIISGYFSGPPILLSPETAAGIKAGAKTGLSTLVCGLLFLFTIFFCPLFSSVPATGTSPLLLLVGLTLFTNTNRIKWTHAPDAVPAFFVLLLIPFTYSILSGVGVGYALYIGIALISGDGVSSWWRPSSGLPSSSAADSSHDINNSFYEYLQSVYLAWGHWKIFAHRCFHTCIQAFTASASMSVSNTTNIGTSESMSTRFAYAFRESFLCLSMTFSCCCWTTLGGMASYLCGDDEDNGDASKFHAHPVLLHHHTFAIHPLSATDSTGSAVHNNVGQELKYYPRRNSEDYHPDDHVKDTHNDGMTPMLSTYIDESREESSTLTSITR